MKLQLTKMSKNGVWIFSQGTVFIVFSGEDDFNFHDMLRQV